MSIKVDPNWWKNLFDEVYLITDARSVCDHDITRREVDLICELIPVNPGNQILDLCGGHGRHSFELYGRGITECTLLDYSSYLVDHAREYAERCHYSMNFIRADARNTGLSSGSFDHVIIMGNSLGYQHETDADRQILLEVRRVLRSAGWVLIDLVNGNLIRNEFNPNAWHEIGKDIVVCRSRELEENTVNVRELVISKREGVLRDQTYSIRFYEPEDFAALLREIGFTGVDIKTDFSPHHHKDDYGFMNHRMIAIGQKP
jgi:D-alanine-D-alanine ligase